MKLRELVLVVVGLVGGMNSRVGALTYEGLGIEYWAGSGSNEAMIVVDFDLNESFIFGYRCSTSDSFNFGFS